MAKKQEPKTASNEQPPQAAQNQPRFRMVPSGGPVCDIYADGISGVMARAGVVKLDLYQAVGVRPNTDVELRRNSHRLVMPATAIPELLRIFQQAMRAAQQPRAQPAAAPAPAAQAAAQSGAKAGTKSGAKKSGSSKKK